MYIYKKYGNNNNLYFRKDNIVFFFVDLKVGFMLVFVFLLEIYLGILFFGIF